MDKDFVDYVAKECTKGCLGCGAAIVAVVLVVGMIVGFLAGWHWR
jgi:hypothetical protein